MSDLERLFELVVARLAAGNRARLQQPIPVADLLSSIVPYRAARRPLGVVTSDEYEHLLLRFVTGEGGFARVAPEAARGRFEAEMHAAKPDLGMLVADTDTVVWLAADKVAATLGGDQRGFAPPAEPVAIRVPDAGPVAAEEPEFAVDGEWEAPSASVAQCAFCGGSLPDGRMVHFCPHCGQHLNVLHCPRCHAEVEFGWRHCIACGTALAEG